MSKETEEIDKMLQAAYFNGRADAAEALKRILKSMAEIAIEHGYASPPVEILMDDDVKPFEDEFGENVIRMPGHNFANAFEGKWIHWKGQV